jgi:DNA-directed RNA polymerase specialized sigma24 family protein
MESTIASAKRHWNRGFLHSPGDAVVSDEPKRKPNRDAKIDTICGKQGFRDELERRLKEIVQDHKPSVPSPSVDELQQRIISLAKSRPNPERNRLKAIVEQAASAELDRARALISLKKLLSQDGTEESVFDNFVDSLQVPQLAVETIPALTNAFVAHTMESIRNGLTYPPPMETLQARFDDQIAILQERFNQIDRLCAATPGSAVYDFIAGNPRYHAALDARSVARTVRSLSIRLAVVAAEYSVGAIVSDTAEEFCEKLLDDLDQATRYAEDGVLLKWLKKEFDNHDQCEDWAQGAYEEILEALKSGRDLDAVRTYLSTVAKHIAKKWLREQRPGGLQNDCQLAIYEEFDIEGDPEESLPALEPTLGEQILMCVEKLPDHRCDQEHPNDGLARLRTIFKLRVREKHTRERVIAVICRLDGVVLCEKTISRRLKKAKSRVEQCVQTQFRWWTYPRDRNEIGD